MELEYQRVSAIQTLKKVKCKIIFLTCNIDPMQLIYNVYPALLLSLLYTATLLKNKPLCSTSDCNDIIKSIVHFITLQ